MALHAIRRGLSTPIHGIVLGRTIGEHRLEVTDAIPVCHEVPTKPIVDMALRLTDAYLQLKQQQQQQANSDEALKNVRIIGWYTANSSAVMAATDASIEEMPNVSACRITSSLSENNASEDGNDDFVLVLVSSSGLVDAIRGEEKSNDPSLSSLCKVFEKNSKSRTFTQRVDSSRIDNGDSDAKSVSELLSKALESFSHFSSDYDDNVAGGSSSKSIPIYDFVDHLTNFGTSVNLAPRDWIENHSVKEIVLGHCKDK